MEKPIFILGSHKSGTSLVRSLLDGIKDFFVVPIETHFFQYSGFWVDYAPRQAHPIKLTFDVWVKNLVQNLQHENSKTPEESRTSDNVLSGHWDVQLFLEFLQKNAADCFEKKDYRSLMNHYIEALHISLFGELPLVNRFVEKSVEHAEYADVLKKLYPDAKFIHVMRNPYATLAALRRHMGRSKRFPFLGKAVRALENSYYYLYKNSLLIDDYLVFRYEDLLLEPFVVMPKVSNFLEIEFVNSLLTPTTLGDSWSGNSTSGLDFNGIEKSPLFDWEKKISSLEIRLVNSLFPHVLRDYNYEKITVHQNAFSPCFGENIKTYTANRFLLLQTLN